MTEAPQKKLNDIQRLTALTGAIKASQHKRVGIRPASQTHIPPIPVSIAPPLTGHNIDKTMDRAYAAWPQCSRWDILGADAWDPAGNFTNPFTYATFDSTFDSETTQEGDSGFSGPG